MKNNASIIKKLMGNSSRLIPFVGFLFVIAGILGLIFIQKPLNSSSELRSDASEASNVQIPWPSITPTYPSQTFFVGENARISFNLNTNLRVIKTHLVFNIINDQIETPNVSINESSGFYAEELEIEKVDDGFLVKLTAKINNMDLLAPEKNIPFLLIDFVPLEKGKIAINFDEDNTFLETFALAYTIDAKAVEFKIIENSGGGDQCTDDVFQCPDGTYVSRIPPECQFAPCPITETEESTQTEENNQTQETKETTETIAQIDQVSIYQCNQNCNSNANCEANYRCFDTGDGKKCRLATNPSSATCSSSQNTGPNKQCNQSCNNSSDCAQGLRCWEGTCRNPNNVESTSCAALTQAQETATVNNCGEACNTNADCEINLRCYSNVCRLVTNPSSLTCSATTNKTVSTIYTDPKEDNSVEKADSTIDSTPVPIVPLKKGDDVIPDSELIFQENQTTDPTQKVAPFSDDEIPTEETLFDLLLNLLKDKQQSLPTTIILIGVGLLIASLVVFLIARAMNSRTQDSDLHKVDTKHIDLETHAVNSNIMPGNATKYSQNERVKELLTRLNEKSKDQN
ncbi:MAG: hypothetical protein H6772_03955 [Pseudomonadales bacterium]|nr:hypothetical protein [Pseudomonadales bacterium]